MLYCAWDCWLYVVSSLQFKKEPKHMFHFQPGAKPYPFILIITLWCKAHNYRPGETEAQKQCFAWDYAWVWNPRVQGYVSFIPFRSLAPSMCSRLPGLTFSKWSHSDLQCSISLQCAAHQNFLWWQQCSKSVLSGERCTGHFWLLLLALEMWIMWFRSWF